MDQLSYEVTYLQTHAVDGCDYGRPLTELCRLDLSRLRHPWPDKSLLDEVRCAFAILLTEIQSPNVLPPLEYRVWDTQITRIGHDNRVFKVTVDKVPMLLKLQENGRITDQPVHEVFVGYHLNKYKSELPFVAYMFGGFSCGVPVAGGTPTGGSPQPCQTIEPSGNYVLYEFIDGFTLGDAMIQGYIDRFEAWTIVRMIRATMIYLNKQTGVIHQDLHFGNIIVRRLDTYYTFTVGGEQFVSQWLPSIIDLARSQIRIGTKIFSPSDAYLKLPAKSLDYDWAALLYNWNEYTGDLKGLLPVGEPNDAYLPVFNGLKPEQYGIFMKELDNKYRRANSEELAAAPPFVEDVIHDLVYRSDQSKCRPIPDRPPRATVEQIIDDISSKVYKLDDDGMEDLILFLQYVNLSAGTIRLMEKSPTNAQYHMITKIRLVISEQFPTVDDDRYLRLLVQWNKYKATLKMLGL
jgi:hypothetical protein